MLHATEGFKLIQNVAAQAYRPDIGGKELKLHAEIDRRIEKAMVRWREPKNKKFYGAKSIDTKQNEVTSLLAKLLHQSDGPECRLKMISFDLKLLRVAA